MTRIASGLLILVAVVAMNGVFPHGVSAAEPTNTLSVRIERPADTRDTSESRGGSRVLALLVALQALSASPVPATQR